MKSDKHNDIMMEVIERIGALEWNSSDLNQLVNSNYDEFSSFVQSSGSALGDYGVQLVSLEASIRENAEESTTVIGQFQSALAMTGKQVTDLKLKGDVQVERLEELEKSLRQETITRRNEIADQNDVISAVRDTDASVEREITTLQDQQRRNKLRIAEAFEVQSRQTGKCFKRYVNIGRDFKENFK